MIVPLGRVLSVEPVLTRHHISGVGADAIFENEQTGWKISMENFLSIVIPVKFDEHDHVLSLPAFEFATLTLHERKPDVPPPTRPPPLSGNKGATPAPRSHK